MRTFTKTARAGEKLADYVNVYTLKHVPDDKLVFTANAIVSVGIEPLPGETLADFDKRIGNIAVCDDTWETAMFSEDVELELGERSY